MRIRTCLFAVLLLASAFLGLSQPEEAFPARIMRWHDGDTAQIRFLSQPPSGISAYETVRLLGINAPEVGEPFADEATRRFRSLTMGKTVYVELSRWERRDNHWRLLAYLWVETEDGWVMVNEAMLEAGLARLLVYYPELEKYYCRFLRALVNAQREKKGLWGKFPEPISLAELEADPLAYVTEAITVIFTVSRFGQDRDGWSLWAAESRYGFRAILFPDSCVGLALLQSLPPAELVGKKVAVSGEVRWESLYGGPRIAVYFPEQIEVWEEK